MKGLPAPQHNRPPYRSVMRMERATCVVADEDHGLAKLQGTGPLLADSKMDSPSAGSTTAQALTGVLGVCLCVFGCVDLYIYGSI